MERPTLSIDQCKAMFSSMKNDEIGMFMRLLWGVSVSEFPITARSINRRLRRITRQAGVARRITIRTWRSAGRKLSEAEMGALSNTAERADAVRDRRLHGIGRRAKQVPVQV